MSDDQAGAVDNRLSLTVADHPEIAEWEDGQTYVFREVRVQQISPGEFEVLETGAGEPAEGAEPETPEAELPEEETTTTPSASRMRGNPAIAKLMAGPMA